MMNDEVVVVVIASVVGGVIDLFLRGKGTQGLHETNPRFIDRVRGWIHGQIAVVAAAADGTDSNQF